MKIEDKLAWLTVHGVLHLLGYDHERSSKDAATMERLEQKILRQC
jgi:rRNA maturation RNase YbeY